MGEKVIKLKSRIKEKWVPCFSNITLGELDLMVINEPPDQLIEYVSEIKMLPLDTINNISMLILTHMILTIFTFMASSTYLRKLCCETKYKGTKKNFRWHITSDMLTMVNMKNKLRKCFSDFDGVENQRLILYKSDKGFNEKRMLEESVLDHYFWIEMFKVNN